MRIVIFNSTQRVVCFFFDSLAAIFAWLFSFNVIFGLSSIFSTYFNEAFLFLPVVICIQVLLICLTRLSLTVWRFSSLADIVKIIKLSFLASIALYICNFLFGSYMNVPSVIFIQYPIYLCFLLLLPRFVYRWIKDRYRYDKGRKNVLIIGAGLAAEALIRDILRDQKRTYFPVAIVDDDARKFGQLIHGVEVVACCENIPELCNKLDLDLIMIATPSANANQMRVIISYCQKAKVPFRTLPGVNDFIKKQVDLSALRPVSLDDLLGRSPVDLDWASIDYEINGKVALVTGGGGSIGSELCFQLAMRKPQRLVVIDSSESNMYLFEQALVEKFPDLKYSCYLISIVEEHGIAAIVKKYSPSVIFHAAAYKHVPILESQLRTALKNNFIGTCILANLAAKFNVEKFVLISTDKAVDPSSKMGLSKRLAELYCQSCHLNSVTKFITVRFGNVLGSSGSVVPLFKKQIQKGGPVTITHQDITRYFMTISEATQLILQSAYIGSGGEIFVLDMGSPVKIYDLACDLIKMHGCTPNDDIDIVYTGLRPGEKIHEKLFYDYESLNATSIKKIYKVNSTLIDKKNTSEFYYSLRDCIDIIEDSDLKVLVNQYWSQLQLLQKNELLID